MPAAAFPICEGPNRTARKVTCLVDGDTGWESGVKWRLQGVDAPELSNPECSNERNLAEDATARLGELMDGGYQIEWTGEKGRYERELVRIRLRDGRDVGIVLVNEGLAQPWPNEGNIWCGR